MDARELRRLKPELDAFLDRYVPLFGRAENYEHAHNSCKVCWQAASDAMWKTSPNRYRGASCARCRNLWLKESGGQRGRENKGDAAHY